MSTAIHTKADEILFNENFSNPNNDIFTCTRETEQLASIVYRMQSQGPRRIVWLIKISARAREQLEYLMNS